MEGNAINISPTLASIWYLHDGIKMNPQCYWKIVSFPLRVEY